MMIFSLVAMIGLEKCCITPAYLQWVCHSGERDVARGLLFTLVMLNKLKKPHPLLNVRQSDYFILVVDTNSHTA